MKFHKDGSQPEGKMIFVFGSNEQGLHGAGAARAAFDNFGAVWGVGTGRQGMSYAIPTKDRRMMTLRLPLIEKNVGEFIAYTHEHPDLSFFITAIGCGLAGRSHEEIAPMFLDAPSDRCSFPDVWEKFLDAE